MLEHQKLRAAAETVLHNDEQKEATKEFYLTCFNQDKGMHIRQCSYVYIVYNLIIINCVQYIAISSYDNNGLHVYILTIGTVLLVIWVKVI